MKTLVTSLIFIAAGAAAWAATPSKTVPTPTRQKLCQSYADAQLRATDIGTVSGTTVTSSYDDKSGFCTVNITNTTPGHTFSGRMMTNTFDASPTTVRIQTFTAPPLQIRYVEPPKRLLCSKVVENKNGTLTCTPYKPDPNADPFFTFPEWGF